MAIHSHLLLMTVYAALVGAVAGALLKDPPRDQLRAAATVFAGLMGTAVAVGWLLYLFPL